MDRRLTVALGLFAGADLALVFLMTNKPGTTAPLVTAVVGLALGGLWASRELRAHRPDLGAASAA